MGSLSQPRLNIFTVGNMRAMICLGQGGLRSLSASGSTCFCLVYQSTLFLLFYSFSSSLLAFLLTHDHVPAIMVARDRLCSLRSSSSSSSSSSSRSSSSSSSSSSRSSSSSSSCCCCSSSSSSSSISSCYISVRLIHMAVIRRITLLLTQGMMCLLIGNCLTLKVLVTTIDALGHFKTG